MREAGLLSTLGGIGMQTKPAGERCSLSPLLVASLSLQEMCEIIATAFVLVSGGSVLRKIIAMNRWYRHASR